MNISTPVMLTSILVVTLIALHHISVQISAYRIYRRHGNRPILMETDLFSRCPGILRRNPWNGTYRFENARTGTTVSMTAADVSQFFLREISQAELSRRTSDIPGYLVQL